MNPYKGQQAYTGNAMQVRYFGVPEASTRMGHIGDPASAVVIGCKVVPIFNEHSIMDGAVKKIVHRIDGKKAVTRVKELLKWAAQARPNGMTVSGKKWKKVLSFQARDAPKGGQQQQRQHGQASNDVSCSSSKLSFKWDVGSCSSASASSVLYSPLSFVSAPAKATEQTLTPSRKQQCMWRLSSMSQRSTSVLEPAIASMVYSSSPQGTEQEEDEEDCRVGQWITTDSDFVVLEL